MSEAVSGIVVAHADLAEALVRAVERISGVSDALVPISNEGLGPEELCARVETALGDGPTVIFADLGRGSCATASRRVAGDTFGVAVISGVSLPVLLDFVFHRNMELGELTARLVERGRAELSRNGPRRGQSPASPDGTAG